MLLSQFTALSVVALLALTAYAPVPLVASEPLPEPQQVMMAGPGAAGAFWGPRHRRFLRALPCPLRERLRLRFQVTIHQYQLESLAIAVKHLGLSKQKGKMFRETYKKHLRKRTKHYLERMRKIRREWRKIFLSYHRKPQPQNSYDEQGGDDQPPPGDFSQGAFAKYVIDVRKDPVRRRRFRTRWEVKLKELDQKVKYEPNLCKFNAILRKMSGGFICPGKMEEHREQVALHKAGQ